MNIHPISVIIPTFNRIQFLPRALGSVFQQSYRCAEVIVVDDGSEDGTSDYIATIHKTCEIPIHYIWQENLGPAAARNSGIARAQYQYIAFLDSDDHWHARKIEKQYMLMERFPEYLISHTYEKWLRRGEHLNQKNKHIPQHGDLFLQCLKLCIVGMSTVMIKKELFSQVGTFDEYFQCCEDYDFWLRVSCKYPLLLINEPLTIKEGGREDQVSQKYRIGMDKLRIQALEKLLIKEDLTSEQIQQVKKELIRKTTIYGKGCIRHDRIEEGESFLHRAVSLKQSLVESVR